MRYEYFTVLLIAFFFPFILSFSREINFYKKPLRLIISICIPFILFIAWDIYATYRGHWNFNDIYIIGYKIINLPVEEVSFFIIIPFCGIFTWESVKYFIKKYHRNIT